MDMVRIMETKNLYNVATESELDKLLAGQGTGLGGFPAPWSMAPRPTPISIGVVWKSASNPHEPQQPIALICREEDIRRLCGRYAQLHSDLSPLTAWCHLLTPQFFE